MRHSCKTGKAKEKPWEVSGNKKGPPVDTTGEFDKHISKEHDKMADNRRRTGGESGSQKDRVGLNHTNIGLCTAQAFGCVLGIMDAVERK